MNNCSLEYIASGCSYMRLNFPEVYDLPEINNYFKILNNVTESHDFSILFNAYSEAGFGPIFQCFKENVKSIMVDSGGLQMITIGNQEITEKMKNEVYEVQGKYGTTALSFDEIPISFSGEASSRLDTSNRWFDMDRYEDCAKLTGQNVANQIQKFLDMKSEAKPIFIAQGNDYDTYMRWTELAMKEIPKEHHKYIRGVAMGAAGLGYGELEDIQKAFYFSELPFETNYMHLLGIGSINRLIPYIVFSQSGLYKDLHISYDSTTHTSCLVMGKYYHEGKIIKLPRKLDQKVYPLIYKDMQEMGFGVPDYDVFYDALSLSGVPYREKYGSRDQMVATAIAYFCCICYKFLQDVDRIFQSKENLMKFYKRKHVIEPLYNIKNKQDFDYWEKHMGQFIKSRAISKGADNKKEVALTDFF